MTDVGLSNTSPCARSVNGVVRQDGSTDEMAWDMHYLVTDMARLITLVPGDVILSGTPAFSRPVEPGDVVTVEVEGLGALTNYVVEGPESGQRRGRRAANRDRRGALDRPRRGLGVPRTTTPEPTDRSTLPYPLVHPRFRS